MSLKSFLKKAAGDVLKQNPFSVETQYLKAKDKRDALGDVRAEANRINMSMHAPTGFDRSMFTVFESGGKLDPGSLIRRHVLDTANQSLSRAQRLGNIFSYNRAIGNMKEMLSRTAGGPNFKKAAPDRLMLRKQARRSMDRAPDTGRAATMLSLGPRF
jgi:hypothetical protein